MLLKAHFGPYVGRVAAIEPIAPVAITKLSPPLIEGYQIS
jgi:hypothetical protein